MPDKEITPSSCARLNRSDSKKRRSRSNRDIAALASLAPVTGGSPGAHDGAPDAGLAAGGEALRATVEIGAGGRPAHAPASFLSRHPIGNYYPWCVMSPASSDWYGCFSQLAT